MTLIPCTILTGFLGAGKTTLLNRILSENHQYKIAVIENEFGPENIDASVLVQDNVEQIIEMTNGCICCTVRGDLINALSSLAQKRAAGQLHFDRVVIETTGLADPGPIAQTFFMDDAVAQHYMLDAVITVVDAFHAMTQLDQHEVARRQVGFADKLLISKTDLISLEQLSILRARLIRMNPRAAIVTAHFGHVPLEALLDVRGFNLNDQLDITPEPPASTHAHHEHHACCSPGCSHDHTHTHTHTHTHAQHIEDIAAFSFISDRPFDLERLEEFLQAMVQVYGEQMLRYKGVLFIEGAPCKVIFQGIHQLMGSDMGQAWGDEAHRQTKMVFIGKNLPQKVFMLGLEQCLV